MADAPRLEAMLETVLYYPAGGREEIGRFYTEALGLREVTRWSDGMAFRVGPGVLLLFDTERLAEREEPYSRHGAVGSGHACFLVSPESYAEWKDHLPARGITIDHEATWDAGARSFYFRDPAGNLLEIADRDMWPS
jgi:catechol 2,3-dioxygenase-like lactoylglutathione lyase family enzyme